MEYRRGLVGLEKNISNINKNTEAKEGPFLKKKSNIRNK